MGLTRKIEVILVVPPTLYPFKQRGKEKVLIPNVVSPPLQSLVESAH